MSAKDAGTKTVRKTLADGTVKVYTYARNKPLQFKEAEPCAIRRLARAYYKSPEFRDLSPRWQRAVEYYVKIIEDKLGWMTARDLARRESRMKFFELRDDHAAFPSKADKMMNVLRSLLGFGYDRVMIDANHAMGIPKLTPSAQNRAENVWTADIRQQFFAHAKPCLRRLCLFALYTGARQSDICRLKWSNISADGWLSFQPAKTHSTTGVWVHLPVYALEPLKTLLESIPHAGDGPILLTDNRPRGWTSENIKRQMRLTKATAQIEEDLTFHDWRGTAETEMLEAGCSEPEAAAILGHALVHGGGPKSYAARSRKLAFNAYTKWNLALTGEAQIINLSRVETTNRQPPDNR